jgi:hypothetical protein
MKQNCNGKYFVRLVIGTVTGALLTPVAISLAVFSMGGGHGDYRLAALLYPWSIILSGFHDRISITCVVIAGLQLPLYGLVIAYRWTQALSTGLIILGLHAAASLIALRTLEDLLG